MQRIGIVHALSQHVPLNICSAQQAFGHDSLNLVNEEPLAKQQANHALDYARDIIIQGNYDVVVLDEVNVASAWGLIEADEVIKLVSEKPENMDLILTGRGASTELIEMADLVTECLNIKHPFDRGIMARKGIDW